MTKSAPPGVAGFNWMESMASLTQGRAAMWIDADGWAPPIEDPNASRVVGKIGYSIVPAGPKGQYSSTYGDGIGIAQASPNKEAAYLYCNGPSRKSWARGCCRPAAACRSAIPSSTTRPCARP